MSTVKVVVLPIRVLQGAELTKHEENAAYLKSHKDQYMTSIQACLKDCVKAQNTDLLTYALTILAPKGWQKTEDASFGYDCLSTRFKVPLEKGLTATSNPTHIMLWAAACPQLGRSF